MTPSSATPVPPVSYFARVGQRALACAARSASRVVRRLCSPPGLRAGLASALLAAAAGLTPAPAAAQPACPTGAPQVFTGQFASNFALERLEMRSGRLNAADWEWGLGANTQNAGSFVSGHTNWISGRAYSYELTVSGTGTGRIVVRDGATVLVDQTYSNVKAPIRSGNALRFYVNSAAGIGAGHTVRLTASTINGHAANVALQTAGTGAFSDQSLVLASTDLANGFSVTGTLTLTFVGSYPPTGSRLSATIHAGNVSCQLASVGLRSLAPDLLTLQTGAVTPLTATLSAPATSDTAIALTSSNPLVLAVPATATVPAGATQTTVQATAGAVAGQATVTATLGSRSAISALTVVSGAAQVQRIEPLALGVGSSANAEARIVLDRVPAADVTAQLSVVPPGLAGVPAAVTLPSGATDKPFTVSGSQPGSGTMVATTGAASAQAALAVTDALPVVARLEPAALSLGVGASGNVTLVLNAAQSTDTAVDLTSLAPLVATVPAQVVVPAGRLSQTFALTGVAPGTAQLQASLNGPVRTITVNVVGSVGLGALVPNPVGIVAGAQTVVDVVLNAIAASDTVVMLTSSNPAIAQAPAQIVIPAGAIGARAVISGLSSAGEPTGHATLAATASGSTASAVVTVFREDFFAEVESLTPSPLVLARGQGGSLVLRLQRATAQPQVITLTSSAPALLGWPTKVTVPAGLTSVDVPVTALAEGSVTLSAQVNGSARTATVQIGPAALVGISLSKTALSVAASATDTLSARAHFSDGSQQDISPSVTWSSSANAIATVSAGVVTGVAAGQANVGVSYASGGQTYLARAKVTVTATPVALSLAGPASLIVGSAAKLTISRSTAATADVAVSLAYSGGAVSGPTSAVIPAGASSVTVAVNAAAVGSSTVVVSAAGYTAASLTISVVPVPGPTIAAISPTQGPVDSTVITVAGSNFAAGPSDHSFTFAGAGGTRVGAVVLTASATQLTVRVPAGAVTGAVQVQTSLGTATGPVFTVTQDQVVDFAASPAALAVYQGASSTVALSLQSVGSVDYVGLMQLAVSGLPAGVSAKFSSPMIARGQNVALTLSAATGAAAIENVPFTITATNTSGGGVAARSATVQVSVRASSNVTGVKGRFVTPQGAGIAAFQVAVQDHNGNIVSQTTSDAAGNFLITGLTPGSVTLRLDGTAANPLYPIWPFTFVHPGNSVIILADWVINPPPSDEKFTAINNATQEQVITDPRFPGLKVTLPAGVSITGWDGVTKTRIAVERIAPEDLPVPTPPFRMREAYQMYFGTPMGGIPSAPIPVTLPNVAEADPGTELDIWFFDGSPMGGTGEWKIAGKGVVSEDGRTVTSLPGQGIPRFCGVCGLVSLDCPQPVQLVPPCQNLAKPFLQQFGKPIDPYTGQELMSTSGLTCGGNTPISTGLSYNPVDSFDGRAGTYGSFGLGWTHDFDIALLPFVGPQKRLVLPGGRQVNLVGDDSAGYLVVNDQALYGARLIKTGANDHPWEIKFRDGVSWRFAPFPGIPGLIRGGPPMFLTEIMRPGSETLKLERDPKGKLTAIASSTRQFRFNYGPNGFVSEIVDDENRTMSYTYISVDPNRPDDLRIKTETDPAGRVTSYSYVGDAEIPADAVCGSQRSMGWRIKSILLPGKTEPVVNHYGAGRRVLRQTHPDGTEFRFRYRVAGACVTHISKPGERCTAASCPTEDSWENHEAGWRVHGGQVVATTAVGADGSVVTLNFNARGLPTAITDTAGQTTRVKYDANGQPTEIVDSLGRLVIMEYDSNGNRSKVMDGLGRVIRASYTPGSFLPASFTRYQDSNFGGEAYPRTYSITYSSGSARPTQISNPLGQTITISYTENGQVSSIANPLGEAAAFKYNSAGDLVSLTDPLGRVIRTERDKVGRPTAKTDALGYTSRIVVNGVNEIHESVDADNQKLRWHYDAAGRLVRLENVSRGADVESYDYDQGDRVVRQRDALGQETFFNYDAGGRLQKITDRQGRVTTFVYDSAGRVASTTNPESSRTFAYDAVGRLVEAVESGNRVRLQYDAADRIVVEEHVVGARSTRLEHTYDVLNQRVRRSVTSSGLDGTFGPDITDYEYDNVGRITAVIYRAGGARNDRTAYIWDAAGRLTSKTLPDGTTLTSSFDSASQLKQMEYRRSDGSLIERLTYEHDARGSITSRASLNPVSLPDTPMTAVYDAANRLTSVTLKPGTAGEVTYTLAYDSVGNLISKTNVNDATDRTTFVWDTVNRLAGLNSPGMNAKFVYDLLGRRAERHIQRAGDPAQITHYLYDGDQSVAALRQPQGPLAPQVAAQITGLQVDEALAEIVRDGAGPAMRRAYVTDQLGSVLALVADDGSVLGAASYSAYGETVASGALPAGGTGYAGRESDGTGLYYYRARYYDPVLKRFIAEDPIGLAAGINQYAYVNGDPINLNDPSGLLAWAPIAPSTSVKIGPVNITYQRLWNTQAPFSPSLGKAWSGVSVTIDKCSYGFVAATGPRDVQSFGVGMSCPISDTCRTFINRRLDYNKPGGNCQIVDRFGFVSPPLHGGNGGLKASIGGGIAWAKPVTGDFRCSPTDEEALYALEIGSRLMMSLGYILDKLSPLLNLRPIWDFN